MKGRENLQEIHEVFNFNTVPIPSTNPNNLNESPSVPLVLANRNDDNYSNASTSYSNAHSEIQFQPKTTNPPLTVLNHHSDDPNKYSEKNSQYINRNQDNQRKREDSGVSRTSITSAHSDMVSDNESISTHSQNNLASSLHMQRFSPDIQEKTISSSSIGNNEASGPYFMNNHQVFNRDFQNSQPYLNSDKNFNKQQKRKSKNFSNKPPFQNNEVYNTDYVPQYNNGVDQGFDVQNSPPMHNINYNNNLRPQNQMKRNFTENLSSPQTNLQYSNGKNNIHKNNPNFPDKIGQEKNYQIIHSDNNNENPLYAFNQFQNREQSYNEMPIMLNNGGGQNVFFFNPPQHFQGKGGHNDPLTKMFKGFQEGQNMMMNSGMPYKMQPNQIYFNQQHPPLPNNGQRNIPLHANNQVQQENIGLKDKLNSTVKSAKECKRELENAKTENTELKALIEATTLTTKGLEEFLKEKDETLQKLITLNEELQASIKQINPDFVFDGHQSQACSTHGLLHDFSSSTMEEILFETQTNSSALKTDHISSVLNEEIVSFEKAVDSYFKENQAVLESLLNMIQTSMMELVPDAECIIYGSFATGLWLPWSDIDLVVKIPQAEAAYSILELLESTLKEKEWIAEVKTIKNTAVPLLKVVCTNAYLQQKFDITIKDFRHNELSCVNLVKEYLVKYPPLRPLSLVLKHLINTLGLNQTYSGGLSSYGLLLMVVFLLQRKESERTSYSSENYNLGELLLSFLQSYGFEYDYYSQYVVNPERILKNGEITNYHLNEANLMNMIKTQQPSFNNPRIIIQDPVSSQNNVGRSTFRIKEIKNAFMAAYFEALKPCTCKVHEYIEKIDNLEEKKEYKCASLLKRMFLAYQVGQ